MTKRRILFFGEPATLAHVARPTVLASGLNPDQWTVAIATGEDFRWIPEQRGLEILDLWSIGTKRYLDAVAKGKVVFPYDVLERYVQDDLRVIRAFKPDVIVGDFRLSLAASARLAGIPYAAITNAYWSPHAAHWQPEMPVHPATRLLGPAVAGRIFSLIAPLVLGHHAEPVNRLMQAHGLKPTGRDLRSAFTEADIALFADVPEMVPMRPDGPTEKFRYLGPIVWSPTDKAPSELLERDADTPLLYVSMGSSGDISAIAQLVRAGTSLGFDVAVAGGHNLPVTGISPRRVFRLGLVAGSQVARVADIVACNGGSPSVHQALLEGTPVLGIPSNLDQMLNMQAVIRQGAGACLRADTLRAHSIEHMIAGISRNRMYLQKAATAGDLLRQLIPSSELANVLDMLCR
jgi:UDP:flavonoid glycosyltransferase YjiC (YdhE family)